LYEKKELYSGGIKWEKEEEIVVYFTVLSTSRESGRNTADVC